MCMEDVRIGRSTVSADASPSIGTTATELVSASLDRYCLIISPPIAGQVTIGFDPNHVASGVGIVLASGADPLVLTIQEHGDMVRRAWYAAVDTGTRSVGVSWSSLQVVKDGKVQGVS